MSRGNFGFDTTQSFCCRLLLPEGKSWHRSRQQAIDDDLAHRRGFAFLRATAP
jgi:hypothetical protein